MAKEHSFDISAKINLQHLKDALAQCDREIKGRFDFKGLLAEITYQEKEKILTLFFLQKY